MIVVVLTARIALMIAQSAKRAKMMDFYTFFVPNVLIYTKVSVPVRPRKKKAGRLLGDRHCSNTVDGYVLL